jgi:hypothetical protein
VTGWGDELLFRSVTGWGDELLSRLDSASQMTTPPALVVDSHAGAPLSFRAGHECQ